MTPYPSLTRRFGAASILAALGASVLVAAPATAAEPATDLIISEYVEGTSNNKAIELYNPTGSPIDMAPYVLELFSNGSATASNPLNLTGTLAAGDTYVIANSQAAAGITDVADTTSNVTNFNGDDALVLRNGSAVVDSFGQVGVDPGTEWAGGGLDDTLRRMASVCSGDTDPFDAFDASVEWEVLPTNTFDGLGTHTTECDGVPAEDVAPTVTSFSPADGAVGVNPAADLEVRFSEAVVVSGSAFSLVCTESGAVPVETSGGPSTYALSPTAEFAEGEDCTLTVNASSVTDIDGDEPNAMAEDASATFTVSDGPIAINVIQGDTDTSPFVGQSVSFEGVVVGDYEGAQPNLRGFYVQSRDEDADDNPATSEGIFVFNNGADEVDLGDVVSVTGTVSEYQNQTQVDFADVTVLDTGASVTPAPVSLPFADADEAERYEGMLVEFGQELFVTEFFQLGRFGEITVSSGDRQDQPTAVVEPGAEANALQAENNLNRIKLDDTVNSQNPAEIIYGGGGEPLAADNTLRGGDSITGLTGVMTYTWAGNSASGNAWRVRPPSPESDAPVFESKNPRPTEAPEVGGSIQVASFNVLNYFTTIDTGGAQCGPTGNLQGCRGADSQLELDRQTDKLVDAMIKLDADVIGIMEMENSTGAEPLAYLADAINEELGEEIYSFVDSGPVGTDTIRVGFLYNATTVTEAGEIAVLDSSVDDRFDDGNNRPALAQTFEETATGETFTAVANHWKSKGSCASSGPNSDQGDGASCWNETRTLAAEAIVDWVATSPTGIEDPDVFILGDLNSYAQEDPIDVLRDAGYVDQGEDGYGYVFDGQWGALDYVFASESLAAQVSGSAHVNINADEPSILDYNTDFKSEAQIADYYSPDWYRTSDHDPLLVGLDLGDDTAAETTEVQILGINDFHGRILPNIANGEAGAAVMAGALNELQEPYENSIFASNGDNIGASSFESSVAYDKPAIDVLNAMGLDVSAVGNHEFDAGFDDLVNRVMNPDAEDGGADWPYLGANVRNEDGTPALPETWTTTLDNGTSSTEDDVTIGFIGVVTDDMPDLVSPTGIDGLAFEDEAIAANRSAAMLEEEGVDAIVLLAHEGAPSSDYADTVDTENNFGDMVVQLDDSIDAVFSGHSHQLYDHEVPVAGWTDRDFGRPVVQGGQYGTFMNELVFEFDNASGELVGIESDLINLGEREQVDPNCVSTTEAPCAMTSVFTPDAEVQEIVDAAVDASAELGAREIGELTEPLNRARLAGGAAGSNRGAESTLGNAIADVHLWATEDNGAQIAFMNPGGLRADLLGNASGTGDYPSPVTFRQAYDVQPFGNTLTTMDLTGEQIGDVLEEQWRAGNTGALLRLGVSEGFVYTYDATAEPGDRILQMWLDDEPIDMDAVYTVATNSFLAGGGDAFTTFTEGANTRDTARVDRDIMISYLEANGSLGTDYDQRAVGLQADTLEVAAGDELSFDLTSLMFTAPGDVLDENVTVSLGRGALGTFAVTNEASATASIDEHGTASVTVRIPAGVYGNLTLWVEGDTTSTRFPIAITVTGDGFEDTATNEHAEAIQWLASEGITQGFSDGTFRPFRNATRDAVATFLYRVEGSPEFTPTGETFTDVSPSLEHYASIEWLASEGVTSGFADGTYRPYGNITRDAFVAFLYRLADSPDVSGEADFTDVDSSLEHAEAIAWAAEVGVVNGWDDGTFRPFEPITRDAIAAMLFRYDALND